VTVALAHDIRSNLTAVQERIRAACDRAARPSDSVTLIAVSKSQPVEAVLAAARAGVGDFGENYVREGLAKLAALRAAGAAERVCFHFIGHLQTNKAAAAAEAFAILHAVDSERLLRRIAGAAKGGHPVAVMLEVNVSGESSKFGVAPSDAPRLASLARSLAGVEPLGLMTMAPHGASEVESRRVFAGLRRLASQLALPALSMGMSDDFEAAIEEGATHVRIGRAIFGERTP
jgi:hypothetical protein